MGLGVVDTSNSLIDPHIVTVNVWRWDGLAWIKEKLLLNAPRQVKVNAT